MNHLKQIQDRLGALELDAMLITAETSEAYAVDFRGEGVVLVTGRGCWYCTDSRYIEAAQARVTGCTILLVEQGKLHRACIREQVERLGLKRLGFEDNAMTVAQYKLWEQTLGELAELVPAGDLVTRLRESKDGEELDRMARAQAITDRTFTEILNDVKEGVTEQEIAARITFYQMRFGASGNSFDPIVASGPNGSMPHAIPGERKIRRGEFVTMDFGCICEGYCSDMTRTVAVGEPGEEMVRVYDTVAKAQLAGIAAAHAGVIGAHVHEAAAAVIREAGYGDYFGHGFGHSLGLEIHEDPGFRPASKGPIPAGAVVSAEPGIYLPGRFGVRIEDVLVVEEGGCRVLTRSPKTLIVL